MRTTLAAAAAALLALCAAGPAAAQEDGRIARDIVRRGTDARGRVGHALAQRTGWKTMRGFSIRFLLKGDDDAFAPIDPETTEFHDGQEFHLEVKTLNDLYIYILNRGPTGNEALLLPWKDEDHLLINEGETRKVPPNDSFVVGQPAGTETFIILASTRPLKWANPSELFKLQRGDQLGVADRDKADGQKATRRQEH